MVAVALPGVIEARLRGLAFVICPALLFGQERDG